MDVFEEGTVWSLVLNNDYAEVCGFVSFRTEDAKEEVDTWGHKSVKKIILCIRSVYPRYGKYTRFL